MNRIIPSNPEILDPDSNDEIIVMFNSEQDEKKAVQILLGLNFFNAITSKIVLSNPTFTKYEISKKQLRLLENTTIKYRVIAPE